MDDQTLKEIEKLNKLQKELEDQIDKEIRDEEEITHAIAEIVSSLIIYQKASTEINGKKYMVKVKIVSKPYSQKKDKKGQPIQERQVILVAVDVTKATLAPKNYIPCIVRSDYNYELTQKGNITIAVEGWVRHVTGTIKPEMLED